MNHKFLKVLTVTFFTTFCFACNSENQGDSILESKGNEVIIDFPEIGQNIKIVAKVWGISGNHEEISILSGSTSNIKDSISKLTFYTSEIFYKKKGKNTLSIFAPFSSFTKEIPTRIGNVEIEIHPLRGADELQHYEMNYNEMELKKVSVYD